VVYVYTQYLSTSQAVGKGPKIIPKTMSETIHELWSAVICSGVSSDKSRGNVGEVQPYAAATENIINVPKLQ
jgi:hypothetical protein